MVKVSEKDSLTSSVSESSDFVNSEAENMGLRLENDGSGEKKKRRASAANDDRFDRKRDSSPILFEVVGLDEPSPDKIDKLSLGGADTKKKNTTLSARGSA